MSRGPVGHGPADPAFAAAVGLHRAGRAEAAAAAYRAILALRPDHPGARHHLGLIALAAGRPDEALEGIGRAAVLAPREPAIQYDLGHAFAALGRLEEAAQAWGRAHRLAPRIADAPANRGAALVMLGRVDEAAQAFRAALVADPGHRLAAVGLADALLRAGRTGEASTAAERARSRHGDLPELDVVRALVLRSAGETARAAALLERAVAAAPGLAAAWGALGLLRLDAGDAAGAVEALGRAETLDPSVAEVPFNLGSALRARDRIGACIAAFDRAIALRPGFAGAHINRAVALIDQGRVEEAEQGLDRALSLQPDHAAAASTRLFALNYRPDRSAASVAEAHREWGVRFAAPLAPARPSWPNPREAGKRLRVGYVSADFRAHSVAYFAAPLLAHHDRTVIECVAYADVARPDGMTDLIRGRVDLWRPIVGLDDAAVAAMVRADGIDLLVDLAGHSFGNRLGVFARRPAPVQGTWLGYPNTTGMTAIDFRITDTTADPPGAEAAHVERLVRLDRPFLCYEPPPDAGPIHPRSVDAPVRFASFNVAGKLSAPTVALWARVLDGVPGATLLLKWRGLDEPATTDLWRGRFAALGIDPARLDLRGMLDARADHLALYGTVDVALDPFPYNGTTTTLEALWMGVPVVALRGERHAGRVGATILAAAGLGDLVAADEDTYLATAAALARDPVRRGALRAGMRDRLQGSPLLDGRGFARAVEAVYRAEWGRFCAGSPA